MGLLYNLMSLFSLIQTVILVLGAGVIGQTPSSLVPAIITFGDSLVDIGNNNYLPTVFKANYPPYGRDFPNHRPTGRFCNGKLATDFAADILGFKTYAPAYHSRREFRRNILLGANFASAGSGFDETTAQLSGAIPLSRQLHHFKKYRYRLVNATNSKQAASIIKDALYIVSFGSSDFIQNYYVNPFINKVYSPNEYSSMLIRTFKQFIKDLYHLGARRIGATSLPPLGCLPIAKTLYRHRESGKCVTRINRDAQRFNAKMNVAASQLQRAHPELKIVVFDIFTPFYNLVLSPSNYGFAEAGRGCCGTGVVETTTLMCNTKSLGTCSNATQYVFWDSAHPSEAANRILAGALIVQGISLL
uniref:GDSL esterase/lipase n=1 Tax=Kalanchoe fedtschenkoi TaxID=63787 RepID=A0A7N0UAQ3_KALFE